MKNTLTFSNIINILIDNKKNTYPQYLLVADLFGLDLGIDFYAGETLGVADSNTIRISNWCTGKRPIPLDIVHENDADDFESMAERFSENICPNILNISLPLSVMPFPTATLMEHSSLLIWQIHS